MQYTPKNKLKNYILRIKRNEANPINDILLNIPKFKEANQIGHDPHASVRSQKSATNFNIDTSNIMKENEYDDSPWTSICNEMMQCSKKDIPTNIMKNIHHKHIQQYNA